MFLIVVKRRDINLFDDDDDDNDGDVYEQVSHLK